MRRRGMRTPMAALAPGERPLSLDVEGVDVGVLVALGNILDSRLDAVSEAEAGVFIVVTETKEETTRGSLNPLVLTKI
jgi:hypothetical protein